MTDENLRRSIRAIGILQYFISFLLLTAGIVLFAFSLLEPNSRWESARGLVGGLFIMAFAVFYFVLARRLREFRPWARTITMVISCIGLLGIPFGTIVNAAFLYVLIKGKHLFPDGTEATGTPPVIPTDPSIGTS